MHGEIKLHTWYPFEAEQVIHWTRGMIWQAAVHMHGLPIHGSDRLTEGLGSSVWKAFGLVPIVKAHGLDITRSVAGRMNLESCWLPSVLTDTAISWTAPDAAHPHASFRAHGDGAEIDFSIDPHGALHSLAMPRWGNPEGQAFHSDPFGGIVEHEQTFEGYTIPARLRVGWHPDTSRFTSDGEFFRATVDTATYR